MQQKYIPTRPTKRGCLLLVFFILLICFLDSITISKYISYEIYGNIIKPFLWIGLAVMVRLFPRARCKSSIRAREGIVWWSIIFAIIFIAVQICAGLFFSFGKSPYSHTVPGILLNILSIGSMIIGRESARFYIVNTFVKKERLVLIIFFSIFMTLPEYPVTKFTGLSGLQEAVEFLAQHLLPDLCQSLLATYLSFIGGIIASASYMGILQGFHWLSPILPNLNWVATALIGVMCPVFFFAAIQNIFLKEKRMLKRNEKKEGILGWMVTSLLSIGIIWFSVGVFPIYPSVIATGSMEPLIMPGDVILVEKVRNEKEIDKLKKGDIIQFRMEDFLVSHRIIEIVEGQNGKGYRTKGDNNNTEDTDLVLPENVKGRVVQIVPKIGWPTLLLKQRKDVPLDKVIF